MQELDNLKEIADYIKEKQIEFYTAYKFLEEHKMFNDCFNDDLWVKVVKVNPGTNAIDDNHFKNTKIQVWLEHGKYEEEYGCCNHDLDLDCGGDTFEEAIIELARLVKANYTDNGEKIIR